MISRMADRHVDLVAGAAALMLVIALALVLGLADLDPEGQGRVDGAVSVLSAFAVSAFGRYTIARRRALGLADESEGDE